MKSHDPQQLSMLEFPDIEAMLYGQGFTAVCGVDEVGRGPLAGPVVAAAVILPVGVTVEGVDDSKKLTKQRREQLFEQIADLGLVCAVGVIDHHVIDSINILQASLLAMKKAVRGLTEVPPFVLVDGNFTIPQLPIPQLAIVQGDSRCKAIATASIIAKVTRDLIMDKYEKLYPQYSFGTHKGYGTPAHLRELSEHGPCEIHRRTFKPVAELVKPYVLQD